MTAGGHASHQDGVFTVSPETAFLLSPAFPVDVRSVHHLGDPLPVLQQIPQGPHQRRRRDDRGNRYVGDLYRDATNPFSVVTYGAGLIYCLQENLYSGGAGISGGDGLDWITRALDEAGFGSILVKPSETGYAIITATPTA
ncbi:MAG: Methyltransferase type 11 [Nocardioides sp.]|nr:Methyltransferase type 11 [Nocardioides sp.]